MEWLGLQEIVKYILWMLSTSLAFAGAWFFKFTRQNSTDPDRLELTRFGKIAFLISLSSFVLGFVLVVSQDKDTHEKAVEARNSEVKLADEARNTQDKLIKSIDNLERVFLNSPQQVTGYVQLSPAKRQAIANLALDPGIRQHIAEPTLEALAALGIATTAADANELSNKSISTFQGQMLWRAARAGKAREVKELLDAGVPVDFRPTPTATSALVGAIHEANYSKLSDPANYVEVVNLLLKEGADPNAVYANKKLSVIYDGLSHPEITRLLLDAGANANGVGTDSKTFTPLMLAASKGYIDTLKLLLLKGAKTDTKNDHGETVCVYAKRGEKPEQVLAALRVTAKCAR